MMRRVRKLPSINYFSPIGDEDRTISEVVLTVDEYESLRLKDLMGLDQVEAATLMGISQATFHRLVTNARKKVAEAIVEGKAIRIEGGTYQTFEQLKGHRHHHGMFTTPEEK